MGVFLELQIQYLLLIQEFREITNGFFDNFFITSTWLGEIVVPFVFLSIIYWGVNKKAGTFLLLTFGINLYVNVFLKMFACIPRPWVLDKRVCPIEKVMEMADGYSFPSGHTTGAMSVWGGTAFWFWNNKVIRYLMITFVCLVAFSRNYVGVHTPQDVLAAILAGVCVIFGVARLQVWLDQDKKRDCLFFPLMFLFGMLLCLYLQIKCHIDLQNGINNLVNPLTMKYSTYGKMGFFFGLFSGLFIERKFVKFEVFSGINEKKVFLVLFGLVCMFGSVWLIKLLLTQFLPQRFVHLLISFYVGLFITFMYPCFIKKHYSC